MDRPTERPETYPFSRFLNARRCYGPSFAPDGTRVAFVADLSGVAEAWSAPTGGGWPEQLTFLNERVGFAEFAPRAERLLVGADVGGDEQVALWLLAPRGEWIRPLTNAPRAMHNHGCWSPDGRHVAYTANELDPAYFDVVIQDVDSGESAILWATRGVYQVEAWSPDGARLLVTEHEAPYRQNLFEIEIATGARRLVTPHSDDARFEGATYGPGGRSIYVRTDLGRDFLGLERFDLGNGSGRPIVEEDWDVDLFSLAPDGKRIAVATNEEGYSRLAILDLATGRKTGVEIPPGVVARGFVGNLRDTLAWSPDGRRLAFSLTTPRETQNVWLADPADGSAWPLTHASVGGIPAEAMAEPELVHYPTFDDRRIPAFLYRAGGVAGRGLAPAVVFIHGGPESQARPGFDAAIQFLVNQGYVVLVPNVRGSTGYGNAYSHLDDVTRRLDSVADANAAARWLGASKIADPGKIAAMGGSYGGYMVLAGLAFHPESWAAGVDLYGVANFVTLLENTHVFRRKLREAEYGSLARDRAFLERASPINHVERIVAPLFAAHGENDIRVPISETEQIVASLQHRGVPVEFIRLPRAGHAIASLEDKLLVYPAIARFLDRHLRPEKLAR